MSTVFTSMTEYWYSRIAVLVLFYRAFGHYNMIRDSSNMPGNQNIHFKKVLSLGPVSPSFPNLFSCPWVGIVAGVKVGQSWEYILHSSSTSGYGFLLSRKSYIDSSVLLTQKMIIGSHRIEEWGYIGQSFLFNILHFIKNSYRILISFANKWADSYWLIPQPILLLITKSADSWAKVEGRSFITFYKISHTL